MPAAALRALGLGLLVVLAACSGDKDDPDATSDADADTDTDTDTDADTDTDTDADTDTDTDTDTVPIGPLGISGLDYQPDPDQPSMLFLSWNQAVAGDVVVEYAVDAGEWRTTPMRSGVVGENERLLVGVPYGEDAEWRIVDPEGTWEAVGPLLDVASPPGAFPEPTLRVSEPSGYLPEGQFMLGSVSEDARGWSGGTYWLWIADREGRLVWLQRTPDEHWTLYATIAVTGDRILYDEQTYWTFSGTQGEDSQIHSIYLDEPIESVGAEGMHHAFIQMPDESFVWGSKSWRRGTESLLQWAPGDKEPTELWNCRDDWPGVEDCESNSMWYDATRDSFLYSFYTTGGYQLNSSLVEIDRSTGTTIWSAGVFGNDMEFDPPGSMFSWQHGINFTDAGTLLLSTHVAVQSSEVAAREYEVDLKNNVLRQVWAYNSNYEAATNGDTHRLANGNTLHAIGSSGQVLEVDTNGDTVWQIDFGDNQLVGRVELFEDLYDFVSPENK